MKRKSGMKDWTVEDRPREKFVSQGKSVLSTAELLGILIGTGSTNQSALDLSKEILNHVGHDLNTLARLGPVELTHIKGIGTAKAVRICAAMELARRKLENQTELKQHIKSSDQAFQIILPKLIDLHHEEFWLILLNRSNLVIRLVRISSGGIHGTVVDPKLIFKHALDYRASGMILAHNHPSGNTKPSRQDRELTGKLVQAAKYLDISLFDHIIVGDKTYYSFADNNLM